MKKLEAWVLSCMKVYHTSDWGIRFDYPDEDVVFPGGGNIYLQVDFEEHGQCVLLIFPCYFDLQPNLQREFIAHELMHILVRPMTEMVTAITHDNDPWFKAFAAFEEGVVQKLARLFAEKLPMPPKLPKRAKVASKG